MSYGQDMQRIILAFTLCALSLVQIGCQSSDKSSILVIAADNFAVSDVNCSSDGHSGTKSGFQLLCNESVRFTHAFTTSTLSSPALGSILTGLYPYQHKVRHNGGPGLAAEIELASEAAVYQNYRTSFFTGGAPVFRRSGLNQGFELFDDSINPGFSNLYRPFKKSAENFMQWLRHDVGNEPYFSVLYAPDLQFTNTVTTTELGETRNLSFESQVDEFDESLYELITQIKSARRWENTTVILVGLSGHNNGDRRDRRDFPTLNLNSENTQVALLIKPAQKKKKGDEPIYWKADQNVTLADVGKTLFELLGESVVENDGGDFPVHSLTGVLKSPEANWSEDRPFPIESAWALWRNAGPLRVAVISQHVLYINDEVPKLYNTLVDRMEATPLPLLQQSLLPTTNRLQSLIKKNQFPAYTPLNSEWLAKLSIPYNRWTRPDQEPLLLRDLKRLGNNHAYKNLNILNWTAQVSLNQRDWETLKNLGIKNGVSVWQYVGEKNLNAKNPKTSDPCIELLTSKEVDATRMKNCNDPLFLDLVDWLRADVRGLAKDSQRKKFERSFKNYMLDQEIQRNNIALGLIWDTSRENLYAPSRAELALHLPENAKIRTQVYKSMTTIDKEDN
ncbi:sulfatase-like hydrolase/transferase [Bdellovibrio sp. HCB288]|uniref:sulfatase-like hydrolase/transferase n=1 Tax=Bdellovibrio sp. HCB288 TaxID=3394355 RepID=UPI0039B45272